MNNDVEQQRHLALKKYTLNSCDEEPIHICEMIQDHGYLIAYDTDTGIIQIASQNCGDFFHIEKISAKKNSLIGENFYTFLINTEQENRLRDTAATMHRDNSRLPVNVQFLSSLVRIDTHRAYSSVLFRSSNLSVVEIEDAPLAQSANGHFGLPLTQHLPDLQQHQSLESLSETMVQHIASLTGYDRVMMYRFDDDFNGSVIAEAKTDELDPFLGLNYPASDIPTQARELYKKNLIRMISDIDSTQVPLLPLLEDSTRPPLDLSNSMLRSVSPFHIEYLRNMGVQATMSVSIVINNELWGLIACHHYSAKTLTQSLRLDCETLGKFFGWQIQTKSQELSLQARQVTDALIDQIIYGFADENNKIDALSSMEAPLLSMMDASGFVLFLGEEIFEVGKVPERDFSKALAEEYRALNIPEVRASRCLKKDFSAYDEEKAQGLAGALFIPLSPKHGYFGIWFRQERVHTVKWAGAPRVKDVDSENRLSPRGSFALWRETVRHHSLSWTDADIKTAERFNKLFVSHVIDRKIDIETNFEKLQELDRAKDQFLASISHELRTPLNVIVGWTDLALSMSDDANQSLEALKIIRRSALTQSELINDLLDVSRIVSGTLKLSVKNVNLVNIVSDVCESFTTASKAKNISLIKIIDNDDQTILGDPVRIKQILMNLVSNAIKFTPKDGKVTVSTRKENSSYIIEVKDTGKGIRKEDLPKIFERFTQLEASHGRTGMGLGLSIVKYLVNMHGGTIDVFSDGLNQGATFKTVFPVSPVAITNGNSSIYF